MPEAKRCPGCKETKPFSEFYKFKATAQCHLYCKKCKGEQGRRWRLKNPQHLVKQRESRQANRSRHADYSRKYRYGLQFGEYSKLLTSQNGRCAICQTNEPGGRGNFHVDHCKTTQKIRGLLCFNCNFAIGYLKHDIDILKNAISYLRP